MFDLDLGTKFNSKLLFFQIYLPVLVQYSVALKIALKKSLGLFRFEFFASQIHFS